MSVKLYLPLPCHDRIRVRLCPRATLQGSEASARSPTVRDGHELRMNCDADQVKSHLSLLNGAIKASSGEQPHKPKPRPTLIPLSTRVSSTR